MENTINDNQDEAFDRLVEMGGEDKWIPRDNLSVHHNTVKALARRKLVQLREFDGKEYVAVAGVILPPLMESGRDEACSA